MFSFTSTTGLYLDWLIDNDFDVLKVTLDQMYDYVAFRRKKGDSHKTIIRLKGILTHFYQSLPGKWNPALLLEFTKEDRPTPTNLIDEEFLGRIYRETEANTLTQKRDKCILGMMVFLGLKRVELRELELEHLDMEEGRILIPETSKSQERHLTLNPVQVMHLSNYVYDIREKLLFERNIPTSKLFFSGGVATDLHGPVGGIIDKLRWQFHYVKSLLQLQQSRMAIWVAKEGLREAQYLGDYKYVTSVMRCDFKSIEELKKKLDFYPPLERIA
jgi:site-specific recombinase XerD